MKKPHYPPGWDEAMVRRVLEHYEKQTEDEAVAEDEAALVAEGSTVMIVPTKLVPKITALISKSQRSNGASGGARRTARSRTDKKKTAR